MRKSKQVAEELRSLVGAALTANAQESFDWASEFLSDGEYGLAVDLYLSAAEASELVLPESLRAEALRFCPSVYKASGTK